MQGYKNKDELKAKYEELRSSMKVADFYGVSKKQILNYIKKFGITPMPNGKTIDIESACKMLDDGVSLKDVAINFNMSYGGLAEKLKKFGINTDRTHKGYIKKESGYILIRNKNHPRADCKGYVPEHIIIIEKHIGRHLNESEVVHHKNEIKSDNRIENLELMTSTEHKKLHGICERKECNLELATKLLYEDGLILNDVAKMFNMCESGLTKKLKRNGLYKPLPRGHKSHKEFRKVYQ